jgi:general secretion pathway protein M
MAFKLAKRESYFLIIGVAALLLWGLFQFVYSPLTENKRRLARAISVKEGIYKDIRQLKNEFDHLKASAAVAKERLKKHDKNFTLFSFLDKLAGKTGIKANITYMKPSTSKGKDLPYTVSMVEMKLQGLNLTQLTDYLYGIEASPNQLYVKRLAITKKGAEAKSVDVVLQVETIKI